MSDNEVTPLVPRPVARTHVQLILAGGNGMQINTTLTPEEAYKELITEGGATRLGYAKIPSMPKPGNKTEVLYAHRQSFVGVILVELGESKEGRIIVPELHTPADILTKKP